ncbi:unnamed protein product [Symbiodinium microadriaticum]|nr:unnamed protein product [Symbiodinium microadriaticum]CAE7945025.1 unnamed protein product [Symbiodinium sp. KB8]
MALSVSSLLSSEVYEHRTCGMQRELLAEVMVAMKALPDTEKAQELCQKVLGMLPGSNAAVLLSPAMGKPFAEASRGSDPTLIVWLLPDPADVDSKQTTFVKTGIENFEETFQAMYKLCPKS